LLALSDVGLLPVEDRDLIDESAEVGAMIVEFRKTVVRNANGNEKRGANAPRFPTS
jgi:hypothetical protein